MCETQEKAITRADKFKKCRQAWRKDPVLFMRQVLNFEPDDWQIEAAHDLAKNPKVSIRSGQGVGKTAFEAAILLWFLVCFPFARVVATAPTRQQLHDVLWSEISKWQSRSILLRKILKWTKTRVYVKKQDERWFAVARTATKPENMQGFHEDNMLFIVDEASGVANVIMEAIDGTLTGENNKLLMCGNPTKTTGAFFDSFHANRTKYKTHVVSARDSNRTNKDNIQFLIDKYGEDSNVVRVRVDGEFPENDDDVFITLSMAEKAVNTDADTKGVISFGVDVARYGADKTVICVKKGNAITFPIVKRGQDLMRTVGDIVLQYKEAIKGYQGKIMVNIDDAGLGGGVTDRLEEVRREQGFSQMVINAVNAGASARNDNYDEEKYENLGTLLWANVRELLREDEASRKKCELSFPNDNELIAQLSTRKYHLTSRGRVALERKEDMKKRGLPSPDKGDAVALACYVPHRASFVTLRG